MTRNTPVQNKPSQITGVFRKPFPQQLAFFRQKLGNLVPTARWDDLRHAEHDHGFMVAGAMKADLLADLAAAIDKGMAHGTSLKEFRKDFRAIVENHGWHGWTGEGSKKGEAWRTRVIYRTNMHAAYMAGRRAQLLAAGFPLWVYKHRDIVKVPRRQHLSWDGLTLPYNHPFWDKHFPPQGFGCRCDVYGAWSERGAARVGGVIDKPLPDGWNSIDPKTGEPPGIDKGWGYAPGASVVDRVNALAGKTMQWDYTLAKAYMDAVPDRLRDAMATAQRGLPSTADAARRYAARVLSDGPSAVPPYQTLGLLTSNDIDRVQGMVAGVSVAGFDYALDASVVGHVQRNHGDAKAEDRRGQRAVTAVDYAALPTLLNAPDRVEDAGVSDVGNPMVRYTKTIGGEMFVAAFEVRKKRRMLVLQSLWIRKAP